VLASSHHGWLSTSDKTWCKAAFPSEELSDVATDAVEEELLGAVMDTADEELADVVTNMVTGGLLDIAINTIGEEFLDTATDTIEGEFLDAMMDTVTGAMASSISVARIPAQLHLKASKSFLVITVQLTMGEPLALR